MTAKPDALILLPRLRVANANAISGPLTWGFPAPSAFTGFVHALRRQLGTDRIVTEDLEVDNELALDGVGVVCHRFEPQVNIARGSYRYRFNLSKNPVDAKKKINSDGSLKGASFAEEGRVHLELSLLIGVHGYLDDEDRDKFAQRVAEAAQAMRLAGGSVQPVAHGQRNRPRYLALSGIVESDQEIFRQLRRRLLPGFALLNRHGLFEEHLAQMRSKDADAGPLDAMLDLTGLHWRPTVDDKEQPDKVDWKASRSHPGWLVPLPVGYGAISPLYEPGQVKNARDNSVPCVFVESLCSIGEWRSPHRIDHPLDMLWYHRANPKSGVYICDHQPAVPATGS